MICAFLQGKRHVLGHHARTAILEGPLNIGKIILLGTLVACIPALSTPPARATGAAQTDGFDWIQGDWCGGADNERIEEHWLSSHGGLRLGLGRTLKGSRTSSFEFLRVNLVDGVATYIAQPQGAPPTAFRRTAGGQNWVRFENPQHDFPKRIEYRRTGNDLYAEIAGPGEDGKEIVIPFAYTACHS
jgi:hypothetical protein